MKMRVERWWEDTDGGKTRVLGEYAFLASLFSTTNIKGTDLVFNTGLRGQV